MMEPTIYVKPQPGQAVEVQYQESQVFQELRAENEQLRLRNQLLAQDYEVLRQQRLRHPHQPMKIVGRDDRGCDFVLQIIDLDPYHAIVQLPAAPKPTILGMVVLDGGLPSMVRNQFFGIPSDGHYGLIRLP